MAANEKNHRQGILEGKARRNKEKRKKALWTETRSAEIEKKSAERSEEREGGCAVAEKEVHSSRGKGKGPG